MKKQKEENNMDYNFEKFLSKKHYTGLKVMVARVGISVSLFKKLGKPEYVNFEIDIINKVIKISSSEKNVNAFEVKQGKAQYYVFNLISSHLPLGRYNMQIEDNGSFICALE